MSCRRVVYVSWCIRASYYRDASTHATGRSSIFCAAFLSCISLQAPSSSLFGAFYLPIQLWRGLGIDTVLLRAVKGWTAWRRSDCLREGPRSVAAAAAASVWEYRGGGSQRQTLMCIAHDDFMVSLASTNPHCTEKQMMFMNTCMHDTRMFINTCMHDTRIPR